jgi:hypothetical protein
MHSQPPIIPTTPPVIEKTNRPVPGLPAFFWVGFALIVFGTAPLLLVLKFSKDPNPNPVGPGILSFLTFWPGLALAVTGLARVWSGKKSSP